MFNVFLDMDFRAALVLLPVIFREKVDDYITIGQVLNAKNLKQVGMHRNLIQIHYIIEFN